VHVIGGQRPTVKEVKEWSNSVCLNYLYKEEERVYYKL